MNNLRCLRPPQKAEEPKPEWLNIVTTAKAKNGIKNGIRRERKLIAKEGKSKYFKIVEALNENNPKLLDELVRHFDLSDAGEFFVRVAEKEYRERCDKKLFSTTRKA